MKSSKLNYKIEVFDFVLSFVFVCKITFHLDRNQNRALSEREAHYETLINEYHTNRDQGILEMQDLRSELVKLQEEKIANETQLNDSINRLKQDFEKQINSLKTQITELENQSLCLVFLVHFFVLHLLTTSCYRSYNNK